MTLANELTETFESLPGSALKNQWNAIYAQEENAFAGLGNVEKHVVKYFKQGSDLAITMPDAFEGEVEMVFTNDYAIPKITFTKFDKSSNIFIGSFTPQKEGSTSWGIIATRKRFVDTGIITMPDLTEILGWKEQWNISQTADISWQVELQSTDVDQFIWLGYPVGIPQNLPDTFDYTAISTDGSFSLGSNPSQLKMSLLSLTSKSNPSPLMKTGFLSDYFMSAFPK